MEPITLSGSANDQHIGFMNLPLEIRTKVYVDFFRSMSVKVHHLRNGTSRCGAEGSEPHVRPDASTNLLLCSRSIYEEAKPLYFRHVTFNFIFQNYSDYAEPFTNAHNDFPGRLCIPPVVTNQVRRATIYHSLGDGTGYIPWALKRYYLASLEVADITCEALPFQVLAAVDYYRSFRELSYTNYATRLSFNLTFRADAYASRLWLKIDDAKQITICGRSPKCTENDLRRIIKTYLNLSMDNMRTAPKALTFDDLSDGVYDKLDVE